MSEPYPYGPGTRGTDTALEAADAIASETARLRRLTWGAIFAAGDRGLTAEEVAAAIGVERVSAQPRTSELRALHRIADSGQRRRNRSGRRAIVWVTRENCHD